VRRGRSASVLVTSVRAGQRRSVPDHLAAEEPLEVRMGGPGQPAMAVGVTMRTPGDDFELAAGFLHTEGLLAPADLGAIRYCVAEGAAQEHNIVTVDVRRPVDPDRLSRRFAATAACGLCGKATLDDLEVRCDPVGPGPVVAPEVLTALPDRLRAAQRVFERTGGLHAAGLFDAAGELLVLREDVGRHNAVDKVVGRALLDGLLPLADRVLLVSGRLGYEIVQKAAVAGIPFVAAVSAPSTLAVETAARFGITLVGFLRGDAFNVYAGLERVGS
jgi:FdhD protein